MKGGEKWERLVRKEVGGGVEEGVKGRNKGAMAGMSMWGRWWVVVGEENEGLYEGGGWLGGCGMGGGLGGGLWG